MTADQTLAVMTKLAELQVQKGTGWIAEQAFPDNAHIQGKAKVHNNNLLGFMAYLDLGHRKQLADWLATQV